MNLKNKPLALWVALALTGHSKIPNGGLKVPKEKRPLKKFSKVMIAKLKVYAVRRKEFLTRNPVCAVTSKRSTQCHHSRGRRGSLLLDERFWVPVNGRGHDFIGRYPNDARKLFWNGIPVLCERGDWGKATLT